MRRNVLLLAFAAMPSLSNGASLCQKGEVDYFSCKIQDSAKSMSLCGSDLRADGAIGPSAWLQYRVGIVGRLELVYPATQQPLLPNFKGDAIVTRDSAVYGVSFKREQTEYALILAPGNLFVGTTSPSGQSKVICGEDQSNANEPRFARFKVLAKELGKRIVPK
ncbi:MAG TPA: hypothetical protein VGC21_14385 [Telluria sp.]|jgi:hypothetical protein